jgi:hypothetical protein
LSSKFAFLLKRKQLLDFDNKQRWFHEQLKRDARVTLHIEVSREQFFKDSFLSIIEAPASKFGAISVTFKGNVLKKYRNNRK